VTKVPGKVGSVGASVAVKIVAMTKFTLIERAALLHEVEVLQELRHQNIVHLYDFYNDNITAYIVSFLGSFR
jgi:serine/threonine protein kinase